MLAGDPSGRGRRTTLADGEGVLPLCASARSVRRVSLDVDDSANLFFTGL
jgi:hypothetical protein